MPLLHLTTKVNAPIQVVFDLARNIDFHQESASKTQEKAIAGRTSGLIELDETVVWEAVHFGIKQQLSTKITAMNAPRSFRDEMQYGAFKSIKHEHFFYLDSARYDKNDFDSPSISFRTGYSYDKNDSINILDTTSASLKASSYYNKNVTLTESNSSSLNKNNKQDYKNIPQHNSKEKQQCATVMVDLFHFEAPLGILGKLANVLFLKKYMTHFLQVRNEAIKREAEKL